MESNQKVKFSKRIKLSHRFNFLITASVVSIVIFAALFYRGQTNLRNTATKSLTQVIDSTEHAKVKNAVQLVGSSISKGIRDFNMSGDSVLYNFVKVYLEDLRYENDKSGYFFVFKGTTCFFIAENRHLEGRDLINTVDEKGFRFVEREYSLVKEGGGFVTHLMKKPGAGVVEKITYVEPIKGTDLWIGSGVYTDNIVEVEASISNIIIKNSARINNSVLIVALLLMAIIIFISLNTKKFIVRPINKITEITDNMALGKLELMEHDNHDEVKNIRDSINNLVTNLKSTAVFAENIGSGNFNADYSKASEFDVIGKSLLDMRDSLKLAKEAEQARIEEENKRNWIMNGHNLIADILRNNQHDIKILFDSVLREVINYADLNQGGVFMVDEHDSSVLNLISSYAYNRQKFHQKTIMVGEGLIGTCAIEREMIYMTDIPNDYINITSGLGGANPSTLLILPMIYDDKLVGIIELASFSKIEDYKIEFLKKIAENTASTIALAQIAIRTADLLERSKGQAEELAAQEEEMRQNLEELQSTNEEWLRKEQQMEAMITELKTENEMLKATVN